jgi:hypothetical protein
VSCSDTRAGAVTTTPPRLSLMRLHETETSELPKTVNPGSAATAAAWPLRTSTPRSTALASCTRTRPPSPGSAGAAGQQAVAQLVAAAAQQARAGRAPTSARGAPASTPRSGRR